MATITNTKHETLITGTSSADTVENDGEYCTITTGNGNDSILNYLLALFVSIANTRDVAQML